MWQLDFGSRGGIGSQTNGRRLADDVHHVEKLDYDDHLGKLDYDDHLGKRCADHHLGYLDDDNDNDSERS